jgi:adenylate cyclase
MADHRQPTSRPADADALQTLSDWIVDQGLTTRDLAPVVDGVCTRLLGLGLPLWRVHVSMATLHPTLAAFGGTWMRDSGFRQEEFTRAAEHTERWRQSPFRTMIDSESLRLRRVLEGDGEGLDFPVLEEFRRDGATDWFARMVRFGAPGGHSGLPGLIMSWVSDRPGGFSASDIDVIERLTPRIALCCYRVTLQQVAQTLLDAYLGADAGRRVLDGQIERGAAIRLLAVLLFADLRGFTRAADRAPGEALLAQVNDYLGDLADTVERHGGQVLKFMGDGLLATFSLEDADPGEVCGRALAAAEAGLAGNMALNRARAAHGGPPLPLDVALHLGEVMYGNVGSAHRLDFTVVGPAVNEAARIEAMCEPLDCPLLISESFARACSRDLRPLGRHALRGVARAQALFTT